MRRTFLSVTSVLVIGLYVGLGAAKASHHLDQGQQVPIMASPTNVPTGKLSTAEVNSRLLISDVIPRNSRIGIFGSFTRDVDAVADRLDSSASNATVLAPVDEAIRSLPRKPWEDPEDYASFSTDAYEGTSGVDRAQENLKKFVEAHVVGVSPWKAGEKAKTLGGREIWWEQDGEKKFIQPGKIEILEVADTVANGEVWILASVLNYAR